MSSMDAEPESKKKYRLRLLIGVPLLVIGGYLLFRYNPGTSGVFPPCPFHYLTGYHCPGCGSLRSVHQLLHGNLVGALQYNPLMVVSIPILILLVLKPRLQNRRYVPWIAFCVLVVYWIIRNIPYWPFLLLAPGQTAS